jgi:hypothetical protein
VSHFDSLTAFLIVAKHEWRRGAVAMSYVVLVLLFSLIVGLDWPWVLLAVLLTAFLIHLMH